MRTISHTDLAAAWDAQRVPREHLAVKCPVCGTVQSYADVRDAAAKATPQHLQAYFGTPTPDMPLHFGFSCLGRFGGAGSAGTPRPGIGCEWTLGGFFSAHTLEVTFTDGSVHPYFEPATAEEAQTRMRERTAA